MLKKSEETLTQTVSNIAAGKVSFTHNAHNCNHKPPRVSGQYTHTHTSKVFLYSIWQFSLQLSVLERISTPTHVHTYKHSHTHTVNCNHARVCVHARICASLYARLTWILYLICGYQEKTKAFYKAVFSDWITHTYTHSRVIERWDDDSISCEYRFVCFSCLSLLQH